MCTGVSSCITISARLPICKEYFDFLLEIIKFGKSKIPAVHDDDDIETKNYVKSFLSETVKFIENEFLIKY